MLFVIKHLSTHNLTKPERQKEGKKGEYKHNLQKWCWSLILQPFARSAVILNHAVVSGSSKILLGNVGQLSKWDWIQRVHYLYEFPQKRSRERDSRLGVCKHSAGLSLENVEGPKCTLNPRSAPPINRMCPLLPRQNFLPESCTSTRDEDSMRADVNFTVLLSNCFKLDPQPEIHQIHTILKNTF